MAAESLLAQLDAADPGTPPSASQIHQIGLVLYQATQSGKEEMPATKMLVTKFSKLVDAVPVAYWEKYVQLLSLAVDRIRRKAESSGELFKDLSESAYGLFSQSPRLCKIAAKSSSLVQHLAQAFDQMQLKPSIKPLSDALIGIISFILLDGLLLGHGKLAEQTDASDSLLDQVLQIVQLLDQESPDVLLRDLQDWQEEAEPLQRTLTETIRQVLYENHDSDTVDYLLQILEGARQSKPRASVPKVESTNASVPISDQPNTATVSRTPSVSAEGEVNRRIAQVRQVFPDMGEGYVEAALSLHQGDVEQTVHMLLGDPSSYPTALRNLDRSLPRRANHRLEVKVNNEVEQEEARRLVKERMALEEEKEQERYKALMYVSRQDDNEFLHNEYDDDYDDQYDDMEDGGLGGLDNGYLDTGDASDYHKIRLYNTLVREEEADAAFWHENRNTNREGTRNKKSAKATPKEPGASDDEDGSSTVKQYRGPDKIKGGRIIGPDGKVVKTTRGKKKAPNKDTTTKNKEPSPSQASSAAPESGERGGGGGGGRGRGGRGGRGGKPRTKPKSGNKIGNRRDAKQKKQGNFGAQ